MLKENLNIVDDNDNIVGIEDRETIHKNGLLHREVHVYFITPNNEIIFQHRAKDKDTFPDLLDATVGGHVEIGNSYEEAAIREAFEETGIAIKIFDLLSVGKFHKESKDNITGKINNVWQQEFIYIYRGNVNDLKIEDGKGLGFEVWSIDKLLRADKITKARFIPYAYIFTSTTLINYIKNNLIQI